MSPFVKTRWLTDGDPFPLVIPDCNRDFRLEFLMNELASDLERPWGEAMFSTQSYLCYKCARQLIFWRMGQSTYQSEDSCSSSSCSGIITGDLDNTWIELG